jgi:hypothetical protein
MKQSKKIELNIIALSDSESQPGNYVVILEDVQGFRRLPIIIGTHEAQAIAVTLEKMQPVRPLTHDLFAQTLKALQVELSEVLIHQFENDIFYTKLTLKNSKLQLTYLDARPSDALALAVRFHCPIYIVESIFHQVGLPIDQSKSFAFKRGSLLEYSVEELEKMLSNLLAKEDYESAGRVRDALEKKKKLE